MDDELIQQIARHAAEHAAATYGKGKTKGQQLTVYQMVFDGALAALMAFEEVIKGRIQRREARFSDN